MRTHFSAHHLHSVDQTALLVEISGDHVPAQKVMVWLGDDDQIMNVTLRMTIHRDVVLSNVAGDSDADVDDMIFEDAKKLMKTVLMLRDGEITLRL